jgi:hypothetical protein
MKLRARTLRSIALLIALYGLSALALSLGS